MCSIESEPNTGEREGKGRRGKWGAVILQQDIRCPHYVIHCKAILLHYILAWSAEAELVDAEHPSAASHIPTDEMMGLN